MDDSNPADCLLDAIAIAFQKGGDGVPPHPGDLLEIKRFIADTIHRRQDEALLYRTGVVEIESATAIELFRRVLEIEMLRDRCDRLEVANNEFANRLQLAHRRYIDPGIEKPKTSEREHAACAELGISGSRRQKQARINQQLLNEYQTLIGAPGIPDQDERWNAVQKLSVKYGIGEDAVLERLKRELRRRRNAGAIIPKILPRD